MGDKALLVGINAYQHVSDLRGCINDVESMRTTLVEEFGFPKDSIRERIDRKAIKSTILEDLEWLLDGARKGDRIVFHFSGHGSYTADLDEEPGERGRDELLCLHDMNWDDPESYLLDDEIREFTARVPRGVQLLLVFDSCHSGTGSRAESPSRGRGGSRSARVAPPLVRDRSASQARADRAGAEMNLGESEPYRIRFVEPPTKIRTAAEAAGSLSRSTFSATRGQVTKAGMNHILLAAARDDQTAADAYIDGSYRGAFTYYLTKAIRELGARADRAKLIQRIESEIQGYTQVPQLESGAKRGPLFKPAGRIDDEAAEPDDSMNDVDSPPSSDLDPTTLENLIRAHQSFLDLVDRMLTTSGTEGGGRPIGIGRARGARSIVAVHGIGVHRAGYSNNWWRALEPFAPSLKPGTLHSASNPSGNRYEVIWSDLVNRVSRDLEGDDSISADAEAMAEELRIELEERASDRGIEMFAGMDTETSSRAPGSSSRGRLDDLFGSLDDFGLYMTHRPTRLAIRGRFLDVVRPLLERGDEIEIFAHSWGTVVAYEGLVLLDLEGRRRGRVRNFFTIGSALSMGAVRLSLADGAERRHKPSIVDRWWNLDAKGDIVGGTLARRYAIDGEFLELEAANCSRFDVACCHSSYFALGNVAVNRDIFGKKIEG